MLVPVIAVLLSCEKENLGDEQGIVTDGDGLSVLPGLFTVNAGADSIKGNEDDKRVRFSSGNLYCIKNTVNDSISYTFAFEDQQYKYHTRYGKVHYDANGNSINGNVVTDVLFPGIQYTLNQSGFFQWVSRNAVGATQDILSSYGAFSSLTATKCVGEGSDCVDFGLTMGSPWFTLSIDEWMYLVNGRPNAANLIGWAKVNGIPGTVIAPDGWDCGSFPICGDGATVDYDGDEWTSAESKGLVFLPAAGYFGQAGSKVYGVGVHGCYWSLSANGSGCAFAVDFNSNGQETLPDGRRNGYSVRLVCSGD